MQNHFVVLDASQPLRCFTDFAVSAKSWAELLLIFPFMTVNKYSICILTCELLFAIIM